MTPRCERSSPMTFDRPQHILESHDNACELTKLTRSISNFFTAGTLRSAKILLERRACGGAWKKRHRGGPKRGGLPALDAAAPPRSTIEN